VAEGARLESVFRGNSNVGSNPTLSAIHLKIPSTLAKLLSSIDRPKTGPEFPSLAGCFNIPLR
jgi:hypothetical protein